MHEMSLMWEIIHLVSEDASLKGINHVSKIDVIVGDLSNVLPDALELAFLYFRNNHVSFIDVNTQLHIIREKAQSKCNSCQLEFEPDYQLAICPMCGLPNSMLISGETFRVESYEGSDKREN